MNACKNTPQLYNTYNIKMMLQEVQVFFIYIFIGDFLLKPRRWQQTSPGNIFIILAY